MKRTLLISLAVVGTQIGTAEEINSTVIHNYRSVSISYDYAYGDPSPDLHGGSGFASYELNNFLIGFGGGYMQGNANNSEIETWSIHADAGYVFRLWDNHLNVIPSFGIGYSETTQTFSFPFFPFSAGFDFDSTAIAPGLSLSYAFNNYVSVNAGYGYGYDLDTHNDAHGFSVGAACALTETVGLELGVHFDSQDGFSGASTGISFHF